MLAIAVVHLPFVRLPAVVGASRADSAGHSVDLRGTVAVVRGIPGMLPPHRVLGDQQLPGGVFMALMDAYGLSLVSVQAWGLLWGASAWRSSSAGWSSPGRAGPEPAGMILLATSPCGPPPCSPAPLHRPLRRHGRLWPDARASRRPSRPCCRRSCPRAAGSGLRLRPERGAGGHADDGVPHRPATQFIFIPFMTDGPAPMIGGWFGTGPTAARPGVRHHGTAGAAADRFRAEQPLLPPAQREVCRLAG